MGHHKNGGISLHRMALDQVLDELARLRLEFNKRFVGRAIATLQFEFQRLAFPQAVIVWMTFDELLDALT